MFTFLLVSCPNHSPQLQLICQLAGFLQLLNNNIIIIVVIIVLFVMRFKSQEQIIVDTIIYNNYVANYLAVRMAWMIVS